MQVIDEIFTLFRTYGDAAYFGEPVTQTAHALQTAWQAEQARAGDTLVVAALLHDVGHLLHSWGERAAAQQLDPGHEGLGAAWLSRHFAPAVTAPVQLHVRAKRYLCATVVGYREGLSPASVHSLALQGGSLTAVEIHDAEANPHWQDAVRLRQWDDAAKVMGLDVPGLPHYRAHLERILSGRGRKE